MSPFMDEDTEAKRDTGQIHMVRAEPEHEPRQSESKTLNTGRAFKKLGTKTWRMSL